MGKKIVKNLVEKIKKFKEKIGVEKAVLFGSYAKGKTNKESDVDLILVDKKFHGKDFHERCKGLWLQWDIDLPVDFLCYTPKELEKLRKKISIVKDALSDGIVIK